MQSVKSTNLKHMVDGTSNPVNEASESREHFQPVYEYLLIALGACWFLVIVCELYFGRDLVDVISFRVQDATWLPANVGPSRSLIGLHHFGDFQIWLGYAAIHNPFANFVKYPPQSPPQALWLFKAILKLGFQQAIGVPKVLLGFWLLSFLSWTKGSSVFLKEMGLQKSELRHLGAISVLSAPFIVTFDRGSLQFIVVGAALLFLHCADKDKNFSASLFFTVAVSLKPYCAILILWPICLRNWRTVWGSLALSFLLTTFAIWTLPSSFNFAVKSFLGALSNHVVGPNLSWLSDSVSSPAAVWKIVNLLRYQPLISKFESESQLVLMVLGLTTLASIVIIISSRFSTKQQTIILLLSTTKLIVPLSGLYTPLWVVALLPLLVREVTSLNSRRDSENHLVNKLSAVFSVFAIMSLLPLPGSVNVGEYAYRYCATIAPMGMTVSIYVSAVYIAVKTIKERLMEPTSQLL